MCLSTLVSWWLMVLSGIGSSSSDPWSHKGKQSIGRTLIHAAECEKWGPGAVTVFLTCPGPGSSPAKLQRHSRHGSSENRTLGRPQTLFLLLLVEDFLSLFNKLHILGSVVTEVC